MGALHGGIRRLLESRHGEPAFVGCLHELALSDADSDCRWLSADTVADSARASGTLHSGLLILERQLLASGGGGGGGGSGGGGGGGGGGGQRGGKQRRASGASDAGSTASLAERAEERLIKIRLAELYRGVGEEDVVRAISHELTASSHMRTALEAEAKGDAELALEGYERARHEAAQATLGGALDGTGLAASAGARDEASGGGGMGGWERALAERGALQARTLLSQWDAICDETRLQMARACASAADGAGSAAAPSSTTFKGSLSQAWVRLWAVSHAKAAARDDDSGFGRWPTADGAAGGGAASTAAAGGGGAACLAPPAPLGAPQARRDAGALLAAGHGSLLLLDRLACDDVNGVRALLPRCVHAFVRRWATLHPLAEGARKAELRPLQIVAEASELTSLLEGVHPIVEDEATGLVTCAPEYTRLLEAWSSRLPSVAHHDTSAWDDLICARKRLVATLTQSVRRALGEQRKGSGYLEADERQAVLGGFEAEARRSMLRLYEHAASASRAQGNYAATKAYLAACKPLRQALGERSDVPAVAISIYRWQLERTRSRGSERWEEMLVEVHERLMGLSEAHVEAGLLPAREACELRALQAEVAWELSCLGKPRIELDDGEESVAELRQRAFGWLRENAEGHGHGAALGPARHARMRLALADLCDKALARLPSAPADAADADAGAGAMMGGEALANVAFEQVVRAMADGSSEARERLPSALALCRHSPSRWEASAALLAVPPLWMSLAWAPQLVAMLYDPHGVVVAPLLQRLAHAYPHALCFPFRVSKAALERHEGIASDPVRAAALRAMSAALASPVVDQLVRGFSDLLHPNLRLNDLIKELLGLLGDGDGEGARALYVDERAAWLTPRRSRGRLDDRGTLLADFGGAFLTELDEVAGEDGRKLAADPKGAAKKLRAKATGKGALERDRLKAWVDGRTKQRDGEAGKELAA